MRRFLAIGVVAVVIALGGAAAPANACGCGVIAPPDGVPATVSHERAIVSMNEGIETIEFTADMVSKANSVGILIPTPTKATVTAGDARTFDLIENAIKPKIVEETDIWGLSLVVPPPPDREVNDSHRVHVGPFVVSTIAPGDSKTMKQWLKRNGFTVTDEAMTTMQSYASQGWSITAVRVDSEQELKGHIDPIRLSFRSADLVYPMRFARLSSTPSSIRLYVFNEKRSYLAQSTQRVLELSAAVTTAWAGSTPDPRLTSLGSYLTVLDVDLSDPPRQASSDIAVIDSSLPQDVITTAARYHTISLLGIPVGTLLVGWLALGLIIAASWAVWRYRAR
jgi:hypothetical protein